MTPLYILILTHTIIPSIYASSLHNKSHKRPLLSSPRSSLDPTSTYKVHHGIPIDIEKDIPYAELYYEDQSDGKRTLIWPPESTLPRDVLATGRPELWLHCTLDTTPYHAKLLPSLIEHYIRLGVAIDRMLFTLHMSNESMVTAQKLAAQKSALSKIENILTFFHIDYRIWYGLATPYAATKALLRSLENIPIKDWILDIHGPEYILFRESTTSRLTQDDSTERKGGHLITVHQMMNRAQLQGATWIKSHRTMNHCLPHAYSSILDTEHGSTAQGEYPTLRTLWSSSQGATNCKTASHHNSNVVVAFRAFFRPDLKESRNTIITMEESISYYTDLEKESKKNIEKTSSTTTERKESLLAMTPYDVYWQFYKSKTMVGNAYLWMDRVFSEYNEISIENHLFTACDHGDEMYQHACEHDDKTDDTISLILPLRDKYVAYVLYTMYHHRT